MVEDRGVRPLGPREHAGVLPAHGRLAAQFPPHPLPVVGVGDVLAPPGLESLRV